VDVETRSVAQVIRQLRAEDYRHVTPTPATIERVNARPGNEIARDLVGVFGWSRPFPDGIVPTALLAELDRARFLHRDGELCRSAIRVSTLGGEFFAHSAFPTIAADAVFFGPDTYRFCRAIRAHLPDPATIRRAVDIGSGAGPGGILVARHAPAAEVLLLDVNESALRLSRANALAAGLANVEARRSDVLGGADGRFDLIVSNPPYLNDPLVRAYRHGGGSHGTALSVRIATEALQRLALGGRLILYTGVAILGGVDPFLAAVEALLRAAPVAWTYEEIDPDVFGEELDSPAYATADRIAAVVLTATRRPS
jgi:methylase of polypeptide subunit release factors